MGAFENIVTLIEEQKSFVLEAGAGSGKTYTLVQTINYLLNTKGDELLKTNQRIVCITYTNVAKNEILERLENNPQVLVATIHEFLWSCIYKYNIQLIVELDKLNTEFHNENPDKYQLGLKDRISEVTYDDSGFRDFENGRLHHDDVISLSLQMFREYPSLTQIVSEKFPYLLIDEYQDTAPETIEAIVNYVLNRHSETFLVGFYGDSYQKIYDKGVGNLEDYVQAEKLSLVTKVDNYRSSRAVLELLNNVRDNITQIIPDNRHDILGGNVTFYNCKYTPRKKKEKIKDYEAKIAPIKEKFYNDVVEELREEGWDFSANGEDKVIILANKKVAERAGFGDLFQCYKDRYQNNAKDRLLKRDDRFASYFLGGLDKKTAKERETGIEHLASYWQTRDYRSVIHYLSTYGNHYVLSKHSDKVDIGNKLNRLMNLRKSGSVGEVFNYCIANNIQRTSNSLSRFMGDLLVDLESFDEETQRSKQRDRMFYDVLKSIPYIQFISAFRHIQEQTSFSTQHGTKGEEYRNVLMVIDDASWKSQFNFEKFFDSSETIDDRLSRTKNLFYVSCSRAKDKLVVLALSEMGEMAIDRVIQWFGEDNFFDYADEDENE